MVPRTPQYYAPETKAPKLPNQSLPLRTPLPLTSCPAPYVPQPGNEACVTMETTSPDHIYRAYGRRDGTVELTTASFPGIVWISYGKDNGNLSVGSIDFSPDNRFLATSDQANQIIIWLVRPATNRRPIYRKIYSQKTVGYVRFVSRDEIGIWMKDGSYTEMHF